MDPAAEGKYRARLLGCHACSEAQKAERSLRSDEHADTGIQIVIERTSEGAT